jgi:acetoacetate decarboxylase
MYMDAEPAITYGREVLGEPKKLASSSLYRSGGAMHGFVERQGVRLMDLRAQLKDDLGPCWTSSAAFNVKATPAADGASCETDAVVTHVAFENNLIRRLAGEGRVVLESGPHDPCGDIPVRETRGATYLEGDFEGSGTSIGTIDRDAFFPYLLGRMDDFTLLDTAAEMG